jgi:ABC-type sugar transport system, permease component
MNSKWNVKNVLLTVLKYFILIFLVFVFLMPLVTMLFSAFKTPEEFRQTALMDLPNNFLNFANFQKAITRGKMVRGFMNTVIIMFFSLIGNVLCGSTVAFVFSRFNMKFNTFVKGMFLISVMIPNIVTQISTFQIIHAMGFYNTRIAPIVLYFGTDIVAIYIFLQFLNNISVSLDESAIIEGANYLQVFSRIIMPLLAPAAVTVLITKGVAIYNDFYIPFLYMPDADLLTISTTLFKFKGPFGAHWEVICAGVIVIMVPTVIAFLALQKYIYNGLVSGSVKE